MKNLKSPRHSLAITLYMLMVVVAGCVPNSIQHGNLVTQEKLDQLVVDSTTKSAVLELLGPPSSKGMFDNASWYYIGANGEQYAFFEPDITEERAIKLIFSKEGLLKKIKLYDARDKEVIDPSPRVTPSRGHDISILEQVFGNFGRRFQQDKK